MAYFFPACFLLHRDARCPLRPVSRHATRALVVHACYRTVMYLNHGILGENLQYSRKPLYQLRHPEPTPPPPSGMVIKAA